MRSLLKWVGFGGILCGLFVGWALLDLRVRKSHAPSRPGVTLQEFRDSGRTIRLIRVFEADSRPYVEVLGAVPKGAFYYAASGPPAYVFDSEGRLADWTPDRGEASRYLKRWGAFNVGKRIDVIEAMRLLSGTNAIRDAMDQNQ